MYIYIHYIYKYVIINVHSICNPCLYAYICLLLDMEIGNSDTAMIKKDFYKYVCMYIYLLYIYKYVITNVHSICITCLYVYIYIYIYNSKSLDVVQSLYFGSKLPSSKALLPKYRDCTTSNDFELYLMCCGVMLQ